MQKVMLLGDALTMGVRSNQQKDNGIGGYRLPLWNALTSNGFDIDFVGTLNNSNTLNSTSPVTFDSDHMGIRRWRVEDLLNGIDPDGPLQSPATEINTQNIDDWMQQYSPDIVLLMAGLNDVTLQWRGLTDFDRNRTPEDLAQETIGELRTLISRITDTGATVLLASPPALFLQLDGSLSTAATQSATNSVKALADQLPALANEFGSSVTFVDIFNDIDADRSISEDGLYLTDEIYNQIASSWYNALVPILDPTIENSSREKPVVIEAEAFDSIDSNYQQETVPGTTATVLSVSHLRPFRSSENVAATASTDPGLAAGKYDIVLSFFDQLTSQSQFQLKVGNTVFPAFTTKTGSEPKPFTSSADDQLQVVDGAKNYTLRTIATQVDIFPGDRVTINFLSDKGENLSFDNIRFVRVGDTDLPATTNTQIGGNSNILDKVPDDLRETQGTPITDLVTGEEVVTVTDVTDSGGTGTGGTGTGLTGDDAILGAIGQALKQLKSGKKGDRIIGTNQKDGLKGTGQNDIVKGKSGNDTLNAKGGNDKAFGGKGNDKIKGGGGSDFLRGDVGKDKLTGGGGLDILWGGNDNDKDILKGGGGPDAYLFKKLMNKPDTVVGFSSGSDIIDMRSVLKGSQYAGSGIEKFNNFVDLVETNGSTEIRVDVDGEIGGDFKTLAILQGVQPEALASSDFAI